ncbi:MAG: hypothetical protein IJK89_00700 [Clostridia bacterium]|nr:hypothetical protein [Clostridia bacterium]
MKKSTKLISLILAVVMVFSASCISVAASAIPAKAQDSVETLLKTGNENLAPVITWLLTNLNGAKNDILATVLKLVYMFIPGDSDNDMMKALKAEIDKIPDVTAAGEERLSKALLDWLDASVLPDLNKNIPDWVGSVAGLFQITVNLGSVDGIIATLYDVCDIANNKIGDGLVLNVGILNNLNEKALKGVKRSGGDANVIKALLQWLSDNTGVIAEAAKGNLDLGLISNFVDVSEYEDLIKNIGVLAKSYLYLLIDGRAKGGNFKKGEMAGDWGNSAYKDYSADQMLAAALIRLINDNDNVVSKADADSALSLSFYGLLGRYAKPLYVRFAVSALNNALKEQINKLKDIPDAKDLFNYDYNFTDASFDEVFTDADATGFLGQLNNIIYICLKTMLTPATFKAVAPVKGGNENLNENLAKLCRCVLPIFANHSADLGFDFSKFTADAVKEMDLPEMAVAVLKIFFPTWFADNYDAKLVDSADTLAQLGLAAAKLAVTNTKWVTLDNGFSAKEYTDKITPDAIKGYTDNECIELIVSIGSKLGAYTLDAAQAQSHFVLDKAASTNWTWREYCDEIVDWAVNFIKGFPAVMVKHVSAERGKYDGNGPFYKVNVALNELINFAFLSNVNDETFKLDTETLIFDTLLGNVINFDVAAIVGVFEANTNEGNILNGKVVGGVIGIVDRILTALFSHTCGASGEFEKELDCTHAISGSYDKNNGHYVGKLTEKTIDNHNYVEMADKRVEATCGAQGTKYYKCTKCGAEKTETIPATGAHTWELTEEDKALGIQVYTCSVCGEEKIENVEPAETVPAGLCDVDGNGKIESADARLALRASVKLEKDIVEGSEKYLRADVNGDKKVGSDDARTILRLSVKLENMDDIKVKYGK